jgi:hypothetical protein
MSTSARSKCTTVVWRMVLLTESDGFPSPLYGEEPNRDFSVTIVSGYFVFLSVTLLRAMAGARDRNRTGMTVSGPGDFKSPVSTNFTTRATDEFYAKCDPCFF